LKRGDIYFVDLDPTAGHEIQKRRPVLIVSPDALNRVSLPLVAPITGGGASARLGLMAVSLTGSGTSTQGVVLCNQIRKLDIKERAGKRVERLPYSLTREVIARIADIYKLCD
jgi:mRNA interferase ChpB